MANYTGLELDEVAEWPVVPQLVVIFVLVLLLQGAGYWFYLQPKVALIEQMKLQEETLKSQVAVKASKVATLPRLKAQLDELSKRYHYLSRQLPVQKELASMLASVNELGLKNSLKFTRIDWGEKQNQAFLYRRPLNMELTGEFHDIGDFAQAIAELPRIIHFADIDWQRISQESQTLHFRVRAYTYQFKPEIEDER